MPDFTYEALDKSGSPTTGTITARDNQDAAVRVRALGVFPTKITLGGKAGSSAAQNGAQEVKGATAAGTVTSKRGKKITRMLLLLFTRQMADLLDAGLPMDRAFSVLIDQTDNAAMRTMMSAMQGDIRAGQPLSDALRKFPNEFPNLYCNMVHAGEVSGQLSSVMMRLAEFMEKEQVRRSQIGAALTYPLVLIGVAVSAVTFLLTFVIPKLSGIFKDLGSNLPITTQMLLAISNILAHYWWAIILAIAGLIFLFRSWVRTEAGNRTFDSFRLRLPLFGTLIRKIVSARLVRTLGTLLGGGVPILEALEISAGSVGNMVATEAILLARGGVRQGETLHESMERTDIFLPVVKHMTAVGEETGRLPQMLIRTADTLDFEVDNTMRRLTSLVEPAVVVLMGGFVGFIVLSILLPIFQANQLAK
jgi:type II secretion system protein F